MVLRRAPEVSVGWCSRRSRHNNTLLVDLCYNNRKTFKHCIKMVSRSFCLKDLSHNFLKCVVYVTAYNVPVWNRLELLISTFLLADASSKRHHTGGFPGLNTPPCIVACQTAFQNIQLKCIFFVIVNTCFHFLFSHSLYDPYFSKTIYSNKSFISIRE